MTTAETINIQPGDTLFHQGKPVLVVEIKAHGVIFTMPSGQYKAAIFSELSLTK